MSDHPRSFFSRAAALLQRAFAAAGSRRVLSPVLSLGVCVLLLIVLQHLSQAVDYRSVIRHLRHLTAGEWSAALGATMLSYVALVGRDAVKLLALCESNGTELRNCPAYIREWITRERADTNGSEQE